MDSPYDYVQIVAADDWQLISIIPIDGSKNIRDVSGGSIIDRFTKNKRLNPTSEDKVAIAHNVPAKVSDAVVVNASSSLRRVTKIISKRDESQITFADNTNLQEPKNIKHNLLDGIITNDIMNKHVQPSQLLQPSPDDIFGSVPSLTVIKGREHMLVGL